MLNKHAWVGTAEVAKILGVSRQRVCDYLRADRIHGAYKLHSKLWLIPLFVGAPIVKRCEKGPKPSWKTLLRPPVQKIHVNQRFLHYNMDHPENPVPIFAAGDYKSKLYGEGVIFSGMSRLVHPGDRKLQCGARAWVETYEPVNFVGKTASYHEIMAIIEAQDKKDALENPGSKKRKSKKVKQEKDERSDPGSLRRKSKAEGFGSQAGSRAKDSKNQLSRATQPECAIA